MIHCGIDAVEIIRFANWHLFSTSKLSRIFTASEIAYCLSEPEKAAERFAVRFAAKEAFYKALSPQLTKTVPFLYVCKLSEVSLCEGFPDLEIDWGNLPVKKTFQTSISLSHTKTTAIAVVIIYQ